MRSFNARRGRMGPELRTVWREQSGPLAMPEGPWQLPPGTVLEIGSGMGDSLLAVAARRPLVIGIDVHLRGLAATVRAAGSSGVDNVRVVRGDAIEVLTRSVPQSSLTEIHVWFPDPWPKAKHRKRRLVRPPVASLLASRLAPGGALLLATDVADYAAVMLDVLAGEPLLRPLGAHGVVERPTWRPVTRYEEAARQAGRPVTELGFMRRPTQD